MPSLFYTPYIITVQIALNFRGFFSPCLIQPPGAANAQIMYKLCVRNGRCGVRRENSSNCVCLTPKE